jgi:hypothetical protein
MDGGVLQLQIVYDLFSLTIGNDLSSAFVDFESQYKINDIFNISFTFSCSLSFLTGRMTYYIDYDENRLQVNLKPMFVYRPFRTGLKGFYISLYQNTGWQSVYKETGTYGFSTGIGIGTNIGYKWIFNNYSRSVMCNTPLTLLEK